jgi:hypothetical protein
MASPGASTIGRHKNDAAPAVAPGSSAPPSLATSKLDPNPLDFRRPGGSGGPKDCAQKEKDQSKEGTTRWRALGY